MKECFSRTIRHRVIPPLLKKQWHTCADRCPKELGTQVKRGEVMFHHEVTNQMLWGMF